MAVERSLGWAAVKKSYQMTGNFVNIEQAKSETSGLIKVQSFIKFFIMIASMAFNFNILI